MRRGGLAPILLALGICLAPALAHPPGKRRPGPEIVESPDGKLIRLHLREDPAAQGWMLKPGEVDGERKPGLIVALHGAGGNPKNFLDTRTVQERHVFYLAVAGHSQIQTQRGTGFQWGSKDAEYVAHLTRHVLATYPVDKERVLIWGHSAGGSMTLQTLAHAPELFAGGLTTAAPRTPDSRHADLRVAVFLGNRDPNWSAAPSVRKHIERIRKKRKKGACAFVAVDGLGHSVPNRDYLALGFDWLLQAKARGGEATVPLEPRGAGGDHSHLLIRYKGAEGAQGVKRSERAARKLAKKILKEIRKKRACFPFEVLCHSEDEETASSGGYLDVSDLEARGVTVPELKQGEVAGPLPGAKGVHLVFRP